MNLEELKHNIGRVAYTRQERVAIITGVQAITLGVYYTGRLLPPDPDAGETVAIIPDDVLAWDDFQEAEESQPDPPKMKESTPDQDILNKIFLYQGREVKVIRYNPGPPFYFKGVCGIVYLDTGEEDSAMVTDLKDVKSKIVGEQGA